MEARHLTFCKSVVWYRWNNDFTSFECRHTDEITSFQETSKKKTDSTFIIALKFIYVCNGFRSGQWQKNYLFKAAACGYFLFSDRNETRTDGRTTRHYVIAPTSLKIYKCIRRNDDRFESKYIFTTPHNPVWPTYPLTRWPILQSHKHWFVCRICTYDNSLYQYFFSRGREERKVLSYFRLRASRIPERTIDLPLQPCSSVQTHKHKFFFRIASSAPPFIAMTRRYSFKFDNLVVGCKFPK